MYSRKELERKEVDDVLGGEGAWDNVDNTAAQCPLEDCGGERAYFFQLQIRSADEPMTTFYKVCFCHFFSFFDLFLLFSFYGCFRKPYLRFKRIH